MLTAGEASACRRLHAAAQARRHHDAESVARLVEGDLVVLEPARRAFGYRAGTESSLAWYESGKATD